ncbi:MAG: ABC transporter permease [Ruminococcus sp.]|nr:ABC transporter permease [Ruminococcus sp.]
MEILKLLIANIKHKKGAFKSIIALTAIIVFSFAGTVSNNDNIDRSLERSHGYADTPTFTVFANKRNLQDNIAEEIAKHPDVTDVTETKCIITENARIEEQKLSKIFFLYRETEDIYRVFNKNFTAYNNNPEPLEKGEIYIPYGLKAASNIEIGSVISFGSEDNPENFTVKGFVEEPFVGAAPIGIKRLFISDSDFERIYENADDLYIGKAADIGVNLTEDSDYITIKEEINDMCGLISNSIISISKTETIQYTKIYSEFGSKILLAFLILLIIIVIISIRHSISTSIEMEYINLGILKSQGFTSGKIRLVYILQYLIAEIIGSIIGLIISIPALKGLGMLFQQITGLLTATDISFMKCGIMAAALIAITMIFVVLSTAKAAKISPVRAISGGKSEIHFDSRLNIPVKTKPLSLFIGLRQFTSRVRSYGGSVLIVALLVYFMMTIAILSQKLTSDVFEEGSLNPNITIYMTKDFNIDNMNEVEQAVLDVDPDAKTIFALNKYVMADGIEIACTSYNRPDDMHKPIDGRMPIYDNEVAVTEISADIFGKGIGDTITIDSKNTEEFIITGTYQGFNDLGKTILITAEGLNKIDVSKPLFMAELSDINLLNEAEKALNDKFGGVIKKLETNTEENSNEGLIELIDFILTILLIVVYAISITFSAVVISMICSKSFIKERTDIGICKAMGFTASTLRTQFAFRFMVIAAIGSCLGGIASFFLTSPLLVILLRMAGLTQLDADINFFTFIVPAAAISLSFFIFAYIAARKINTVEIRELISE